jgi:hypothetical protein
MNLTNVFLKLSSDHRGWKRKVIEDPDKSSISFIHERGLKATLNTTGKKNILFNPKTVLSLNFKESGQNYRQKFDVPNSVVLCWGYLLNKRLAVLAKMLEEGQDYYCNKRFTNRVVAKTVEAIQNKDWVGNWVTDTKITSKYIYRSEAYSIIIDFLGLYNNPYDSFLHCWRNVMEITLVDEFGKDKITLASTRGLAQDSEHIMRLLHKYDIAFKHWENADISTINKFLYKIEIIE